MGRITARRRVTRIRRDAAPTQRADTLAVEEPLEIRVRGTSISVTMRTPGNDFELVAGYLVSEGVIATGADYSTARYCAGTDADGINTYNVVDVSLAAHVPATAPGLARATTTTSACGICGKDSIESVHTASVRDPGADPMTIAANAVLDLPDRLRAEQTVFDKTGGLHAAALFAADGTLLTVREDVGRHNAVDKVVGWAVLADRLPLTGTVLQVSGRASFELVQKAAMAGIPMLCAVSAPSSLAVDAADDLGITLVGFSRGESMVVYTRPDRITAPVTEHAVTEHAAVAPN
ncbi:formate dehydrogenase accessory sulfurtransferase FdhD [Gordonia terrae]|uniref:Sulfur carrier protein FdhD n=1 Tax=Gordonia terrae TaxID=2055 RepID=A0AAD0KHD8_9ACTN|nr:formate dehydrogenase accessory sulfurtransferase FdhD [Gordonia terrae]ANY26202.1 formate dehydrogenase accessory protein FdhD [Gordonia terrae]AWO86937.1 formate dehydrogenase accessory sulfurtransferase FdhD [Gordonia terrae]VTS59406.1 formate dehydrogenase accessory protein [Gordonia terrae]